MISQCRLHLLSTELPLRRAGWRPVSEARTRVKSNDAHAFRVYVCFAVDGV